MSNTIFPKPLYTKLISIFRTIILLLTAQNLFAQSTFNLFAPLQGPPGTRVAITGNTYSSIDTNITVYFGAVRAQIVEYSNSKIDVIVPPGATSDFINVTVRSAGTFNTTYSNVPFKVTYPGPDTINQYFFHERIDSSIDPFPGNAVTGDFDLDGKPDVVIMTSKFDILKNISVPGALNFTKSTAQIPGLFGSGLVKADINGDGKLDIIATENYTKSFAIFYNTSNADSISFTDKVSYQCSGAPVSIAVADLNADNKPEIIVACKETDTVSVFANINFEGGISYFKTGGFAVNFEPGSLTVSDIDNDLRPDIIVTSDFKNTVSVLRNKTNIYEFNMSFDAPINFNTGVGPVFVAAADFNNDGKTDIVTANRAGKSYSVLQNTSTQGNLSFSEAINFSADLPVGSVSVTDVDGDGKPDLALCYSNTYSFLIAVSRNTSAQQISFSAPVKYNVGGNPISIAVSDLDLDGKPDLIVPNNSSFISFFRNQAGENSKAVLSIKSFYPDRAIAETEVEIKGTGFDAVKEKNMVYFGGVASVVKNVTDTSLTVIVPYGASFKPISVIVDGHVAASSRPFLPTFKGNSQLINGRSFYNQDNRFPDINRPIGVCTADLDNDGKQEVIITGYNYGTVAIFTTNGKKGQILLTPLANYKSGNGSTQVVAADIDGDGKLDLAVLNYLDVTVSFFRNTSTGSAISFDAKVTVPAYGTSIAFRDLDGDGHPDMAVGNEQGVAYFCKNNSVVGKINMGKLQKYGELIGRTVELQDLNGDNRPDLLVGDGRNNAVRIYVNNSVYGIPSFEMPQSFETAKNPRVTSAADFDNDGKLDMIAGSLGEGKFSVFKNTSENNQLSFSPRKDFGPFLDPEVLAIADLNGDGKPDVLNQSTPDQTMNIMQNLSTDTLAFSAGIPLVSSSFYAAFAIADLNEDGKPDIIAVDDHSNHVNIFTNFTGSVISILDGNWSDPSIWIDNKIPSVNDDVVIKTNVTIDKDVACKSLIVLGNALTTAAGKHLTVTGR